MSSLALRLEKKKVPTLLVTRDAWGNNIGTNKKQGGRVGNAFALFSYFVIVSFPGSRDESNNDFGNSVT